MDKPELVYGIFLVMALLITILVLLFLGITAYIKKRTVHQQQLIKLQADFAATLLQSQLEIKESTLKHVSRELHDNLGHVSSLIKINLTTINLNDPEKARVKLDDTMNLTRQMIGDLKKLSRNLGPDRITRIGLVKSIEQEMDLINRTGEFQAEFQTEGIIPALPEDKMIILFRMVQEILHNMVKHSSAKQLLINLKGLEKSLILSLSDDGTGFNVEEKLYGEGAGLQNLQNRAKLLSAELSIQSALSKGTQITINLPI
jgi:two-component system, NarL family, sensor kinase